MSNSSFTAITVHLHFDLNCLKGNNFSSNEKSKKTQEIETEREEKEWEREKGRLCASGYLHWFASASSAGISAKVRKVVEGTHSLFGDRERERGGREVGARVTD